MNRHEEARQMENFVLDTMREAVGLLWQASDLIQYHPAKGNRSSPRDSHHDLYRPILRALHRLRYQGKIDCATTTNNDTVWWLTSRVLTKQEAQERAERDQWVIDNVPF